MYLFCSCCIAKHFGIEVWCG